MKVCCPKCLFSLHSQRLCCAAVRVPQELQGGCSSKASVQLPDPAEKPSSQSGMPSAGAAVVTKEQDQQPAASLPLQAAPQHNIAPLQGLGVNNGSPSSEYVPKPASRCAPAQPCSPFISDYPACKNACLPWHSTCLSTIRLGLFLGNLCAMHILKGDARSTGGGSI